MTVPSFKARAKQWSSPPVDDVGYIPAADMLKMDDKDLLALVNDFEVARYQGWRNWRNRWRDVLRLDMTKQKNVLDYGCGVGIEALQYAKAGNYVSLADIAPDNVRLASRIIHLHGFKTVHEMVIDENEPFLPYLHPKTDKHDSFDVIHCAGVLHHIPDPVAVIRSMHKWTRRDGELRLMLYSNVAWEIATKTLAPEGDVHDYVEFDQFWQHWDPIGGYADWYDVEKLRHRFGQWFKVLRYEPLTRNGAYVGAVMVKV